MSIYIVKRLLLSLPTLLLVSFIIFSLVRIVPGDVVIARVAESGYFSEEDLDEIRTELGLDRPFFEQYGTWLWNVSHGDLGRSLWSDEPVLPAIVQRLRVSGAARDLRDGDGGADLRSAGGPFRDKPRFPRGLRCPAVRDPRALVTGLLDRDRAHSLPDPVRGVVTRVRVSLAVLRTLEELPGDDLPDADRRVPALGDQLAYDALHDARGAPQRLCAHRASEGAGRADRALPARAPQRSAARDHDHGRATHVAARRARGDRDDLLAARRRPPHVRRGDAARLHGGSGHGDGIRGGLRLREPRRGPVLRGDRSTDSATASRSRPCGRPEERR